MWNPNTTIPPAPPLPMFGIGMVILRFKYLYIYIYTHIYMHVYIYVYRSETTEDPNNKESQRNKLQAVHPWCRSFREDRNKSEPS